MRLAGAERTQADAFLHTALELELNFFDHADIYGGGACERVFGEMIKDAGVRREDLIIQSKCAIVPGKMYDFSKEHILSAVDGRRNLSQSSGLIILRSALRDLQR